MFSHTSIITFVFLISIIFLSVYSVNTENYKNVSKIPIKKRNRIIFSKSFQIENQIKCESDHLGWKNFWRTNYSKFSDNLNNVFKDKANKTNPPLLFDGVRNINSCPL